MQHKSGASASQLVEVRGATADLRHLGWAIVIGVAISLAGFLIANRILAGSVGTPELARAYAMLAGLAGCITAGVICAVIFKPKREVIEGTAADPRWREEVLRELAEQTGDLGSLDDLPPAVVKEMKELQLYELFANHQSRGPASTPAAVKPSATSTTDTRSA